MSNSLSAPPEVIASWPPRNAIDPATKGSAIDYVAGFFSALGVIVVVLRLYVRLYITRAIGIDDVLITVGLAGMVALSVLLSFGAHNWYLGYHIWDLTYDQVVHHRYGTFIVTYVSVCSSNIIRLSVLMFYKRLSKGVHSELLIASWVGITYNVLAIIIMCIANTFICYPTSAYWNRYNPAWVQENRFICGNEGISLPACNIALVISDFYCTILPLVMFLKMQLTIRQKVQLAAVFSLGFFACAAGTTRVVYLVRSVSQKFDFTWEVYDMWIWVIVESYLGIVAACAPALKIVPGRIRELGFAKAMAPVPKGRSTIRSVAHTPTPPRALGGSVDLPMWKVSDADAYSLGDVKSVSRLHYFGSHSS